MILFEIFLRNEWIAQKDDQNGRRNTEQQSTEQESYRYAALALFKQQHCSHTILFQM